MAAAHSSAADAPPVSMMHASRKGGIGIHVQYWWDMELPWAIRDGTAAASMMAVKAVHEDTL